MSKLFLSSLLALVPILATANPTYLPALKGAVFEDLLSHADFQLEPGTLKKCRPVQDTSTMYDCELDGASATVTDGARSRAFAFKSVKIWFRNYQGIGPYNEYIFQGEWTDTINGMPVVTKSVLDLWYAQKEPSRVQGNFSLPSLGVTRAVRATP